MRQTIHITRGKPLTIEVDGAPLDTFEGETLAAALIASGARATRRDTAGKPRGFWCAMGTCAECFVERCDVMPARRLRACLLTVAPGMRIRTALADTDD